MLEVASTTAEAIAIQQDIIARIVAGEDVSFMRHFWLNPANAVRQGALEALRAHRKTHYRFNGAGSFS